jgi:hypothetical protein
MKLMNLSLIRLLTQRQLPPIQMLHLPQQVALPPIQMLPLFHQ